MGNIESALRFIDYFINKIEFYNNEDFEEMPVSIDFSITRKIEYINDEDNTFLVTLDIRIFENASENNYPFSMNISITGIFEIDDNNVKDKENFAEVNSIAILFPYLRSIVSTYTANANVQPLILPPINVVRMIQEDKESDSSKETGSITSLGE